jgi:alpha-glucosidase/alpha-D-xyloside xylohydrolase
VYEDDGISFNYRKGEWMGLQLDWNDTRRRLTMNLAKGSRMLSPGIRHIEVRFNQTTRALDFDGKPVDVFF